MVRLKHRWLLFNIIYPSEPSAVPFSAPSTNVTPKVLTDALRQQISYNFGDHGSGLVSSSLQIKYFSVATSTGIVRIARDHFRLVWAALTFIKEIEGRECIITVQRVSGTVKKAEQEILRRDRQALDTVRTGRIGKKA
jgi:ribonuclease P/MRP protein subunit POP5